MADDTEVFHERQFLELCLLHTLNNLFQRKEFTKARLDEICRGLAPESFIFWNPHRSPLGLGNYDVNVLISALQSKGFSAVWMDKRKNPAELNLTKIFGFIRNVPSQPQFGFLSLPFLKRRHWAAVRQVGEVFYDFDSKLPRPHVVGDETQLLKMLQRDVVASDCQIFIVVTKEVETDGSWLKSNQH